MIVWLGLTELAWTSYWLLRTGDVAPGYRTTVVVWIVAMLVWLALVIRTGTRDFFLKHTRWLSNLVGNHPDRARPLVLVTASDDPVGAG